MFSLKSVISSLFMIIALLWLTISTPFVFASQQAQQKEVQKQAGTDKNPLSTTTEEKNESSVSTLSEYLHDLNLMSHHFIVLTRMYKCHTSDLYYAYHPELLSPPPKV